MSYYDDIPIGDLLEIHVDLYDNDYRRAWGIDDESPPEGVPREDWILANDLSQVGEALVASACTLDASPSLREFVRQLRPGDPLGSAVWDLSAYNVAADKVAIELAWSAVGRLKVARDRFLWLLRLVNDRPISMRAKAYLARAAELYLWQFDAECVVMCRGTLDAALQDRVSDDQLEKVGFKRARLGFDMAQRIEAAVRLGLLSEDSAKWTNDVRVGANHALHVAPGLAPDPLASLAQTAAVLQRLFPE